ncbi:MAG: diacylglycerol kinase family protein [Chitinophagales bacterium]
MMEKWMVFINPISGNNSGEQAWKKMKPLLDQMKISYEAHYTEKAFHAISLAKDARDKGYNRFVSIGGDGTINEIINGVFLSDHQNDIPKFALIGIGTGNDTIKTFGIPSKPEKAVELFSKGKFKTIDLGKVYFQNEKGERASRLFVNIAGMAFDAAVTDNANNAKQSMGKLAYLKGVFKTLSSYTPGKVKVRIDDREPIEDIMFSLNVSNCKYSGGGMLIAPHAVPDDGKFAITLIKNVGKWRIGANIYRLFNGTLEKVNGIELHSGKKVKVEASPETMVEVEGELLGAAPFEFEIMPSSIELLVP